MRPASPAHQLLRGYRVQRSVVFALFMKEYRAKLSGSRFGLFWSLVEPAAYVVVLSTVWLAVGRSTMGGVPIYLFVAAGMLPMKLYQMAIGTVSAAVRQNVALLDYPNVKPIDAIYARYLSESLIVGASGTGLIAALYWIAAYDVTARDKPLLLVTVLLMIMNTLAISLFLGVYRAKSESFHRAVTVASQPLLYISAVFYPLSIMPLKVQYWLSWNPIVQVNELIRTAVFGWALPRDVSLEYLFALTTASLFLAYVSYYANRFSLLKR